MPQPDEPRELTPVQMFWDKRSGLKDFGPHVQRVDQEEAKEVEEAITPAPKEESALAFVGSEGSRLTSAPVISGTPVPSPVEAGNGKPSESSEDEQTTETTTSPNPGSSSPDSLPVTPTSPGSPPPPVLPKPLTSD